MKEIIAVINQKGGVGKSTTVFALGEGLILKGYKVLFIDLDAQGNLSYAMKSNNEYGNSFDILNGDLENNFIQSTDSGDLICSSPKLATADISLTSTGKEYKLKESLNSFVNTYDYIIIDTPPALGILTINALTAATSVIIPAQTDIYSIQGIGQLYKTIQAVKRYTNSNLKIKGILLTRYNSRSVLSRELKQMIENTAKELETIVFNTKIREGIAIKESQAMRKGIFEYAPKSNPAQDYQLFVNEILN